MTTFLDPQMNSQWQAILGDEFEKPYMKALDIFLSAQRSLGKVIYPAPDDIFNALKHTVPDKVKVVILGQDPYHGPGQAHGLSFSVPEGVKVPPSLRNIYKEIGRSTQGPAPDHGCLLSWADQGVLLLNATLTVEQGLAGSHQNQGWEVFTDTIMSLLNERYEGLVFMLWGAYAKKKGRFLNVDRHLILSSVHPSPLSAHRGFLGCNHFVLANRYLSEHGKTMINWGG